MTDILLTALGWIALGLTASGFWLKQSLLLILAGIFWVLFGTGTLDHAPDLGHQILMGALASALVCFIWPLVVWQRGRDRRAPEERDYENYRQKVHDLTKRR